MAYLECCLYFSYCPRMACCVANKGFIQIPCVRKLVKDEAGHRRATPIIGCYQYSLLVHWFRKLKKDWE